MKNTFKTLAVIALAALSTNAFAQNSDQATATASATIVCPISLTSAEGNALAFGNIVQGNGNVTIDATTGDRTFSNTAMDPGTSNAGTTSRAHFTVTGESGFSYNISIPSSVTVTGPSNTASADLQGSKTSGSLGEGQGCSATDDFYVGGILHLTNSNGPGQYSGSFSATVTYN